MPAVTGSGASVNVIDRSAEPLTVVVADAVLRPGPGSAVVDATVTVAFSGPVALGATRATTTTLRALAAPVPVAAAQLQTTGLAALQIPPALGVAETKLVPAGSGKLIDTAAAEPGPLLVAVAV